MSEYRILKNSYTSAKLMPYPGTIVRVNHTTKISLASAIRQFLNGSDTFCNVKETALNRITDVSKKTFLWLKMPQREFM